KRSRLAPLGVLATAIAIPLAGPAVADAAVTSTVTGGVLKVTSDNADAITVTTAGGNVKVNTADPGAPTAASAITAIEVTGGAGANTIDLSAVNAATDFTALANVKVEGGEGNDTITGTTRADNLDGQGGNDRVIGARGNDTMLGGAGLDTLVWNNGDGSDRMDGEGGSDTIEVNGAAAAGDAFTLQPNGARARFDRTNLVPFTLDIGSSELLDLNGLGGDDTFTPSAGSESLIGTLLLDGGPGNDTLAGGASADVVSGGSGNDTLNGGGGSDDVLGEAGDDVLALRDNSPDLGVCGSGTDRATADVAGVDALVACEQVDQPAAADTRATALRIRSGRGSVSRRSRRPSVRVTVNCPSTEPGGCAGTLTLTTLGAVRAGRVRAVVVLGTARFKLRSGQTRTLRVRLASGATRLARRGRIRARARAVSRDAARNVAESTRRYTITVRR
ncbi:MAG TPA: hypothetical protein VES79_07975, partial [Solirubrobacteraceae bacterium]|nr:hypothetical protein [Solirubrobacteraceae bacterium]